MGVAIETTLGPMSRNTIRESKPVLFSEKYTMTVPKYVMILSEVYKLMNEWKWNDKLTLT